LTANVTSTATSIQLQDDLPGITSAAIFGVDAELMYVRTTPVRPTTATVTRGWLGTTPAAHSLGDPVEVNPRVPVVEIKRALKDEIASWGSSVFRRAALDASTGSSTRTIDLSAFDQGCFSIIGVWKTATSSQGRAYPRAKYRIVASVPDFPNGVIVLNDNPGTASIYTVIAGTPFDLTTWDDDTDLETDCGLEASMLDIPPLGAAWRLLAPREIDRMEMGTQGEPRSAQEVQGGMTAAVARGLKALRDTRLADEAARLKNMYPWSMG